MSKRLESTSPPERLLREIGRRWPDGWRAMRSAAATYKSEYGWPDWCPLPLGMAMAAYCETHPDEIGAMVASHAESEHILAMGSAYQWRMTKGVYRFAPELYRALVDQPLDGDLPVSLLYRLPEWAVYIETPGYSLDGTASVGVMAHLDYNMTEQWDEMQLLLFGGDDVYPRMIALPLGDGTIADAVRMLHEHDRRAIGDSHRVLSKVDDEQLSAEFGQIVQLLLYLCSDDSDMPQIEHPIQRVRQSGAVDAPKDARVWEVGVRIGAAIRKYGNQQAAAEGQDTGTHASPRPHVRRAHWHSYWVGPRDGERSLRVRWLPPIPVGVDWTNEQPVVIRPVK